VNDNLTADLLTGLPDDLVAGPLATREARMQQITDAYTAVGAVPPSTAQVAAERGRRQRPAQRQASAAAREAQVARRIKAGDWPATSTEPTTTSTFQRKARK